MRKQPVAETEEDVGGFKGFFNGSDMGFLLIYFSCPLYQCNSAFSQPTAVMMPVILQLHKESGKGRGAAVSIHIKSQVPGTGPRAAHKPSSGP